MIIGRETNFYDLGFDWGGWFKLRDVEYWVDSTEVIR